MIICEITLCPRRSGLSIFLFCMALPAEEKSLDSFVDVSQVKEVGVLFLKWKGFAILSYDTEMACTSYLTLFEWVHSGRPTERLMNCFFLNGRSKRDGAGISY